MTGLLSFILSVPAVLIFLLALFFAVEVGGALLPARKRKAATHRNGRIAVIIPAHNEGLSLAPTLQDVKRQINKDDRIIVVADNCTDNTAAVVIEEGAECLSRTNNEFRGKGYALQFALDELKNDPPDVVVFIDADCRLREGTIETIAAEAETSLRPVQALYLMQAAKGDGPQRRVAEFAWTLINEVRMSGLYNLFDTTRLTGAGMALPWKLAANLSVGTGEIVEDLSLSLDLTREGVAPIFVREAVVLSEFPSNDDAAAKQRARWEHGSMRLAQRNLVGLFLDGIKRGDLRLIAMAFDLSIPPLTVFAAIIIAGGIGSLIALLFGIALPFSFMALSGVLFVGAVSVSWFFFGRDILPASSVQNIAGYMVSKRKVYEDEARQSTKTWTRTERASDRPASSSPKND